MNDILREELEVLIKRKDNLESEIAALVNYLQSPGNPGLKGGLVDSEGFPIGDVEKIIAVREARASLSRKQNDHLQLMKEIEEGLERFHVASKARRVVLLKEDVKPTERELTKEDVKPTERELIEVAVKPTKRDARIVSLLEPPFHKPFAKVNSVDPSSPAEEVR
eukprot:TRINITY_DN6147_c0_g1_i13.p1 TRINITY_DN6147_c0_g1~~TRINITY_DN6147_c0_g1_i13.p1  ORF type:complete len:165 (-),score=37.22 TRINITY_DN6147_c0_g1_i13:576-1070(-)